MARRRPKSSPIEDFVALVALLPWWACLGVGLVSYLVLHAMSGPVVRTGVQPNELEMAIASTMFHTMASICQYLLPLACLTAAGISVAKQQRRGHLVAGVAQSKAPDALDGMSWQDFELLVGEAFRLQGYEVTELGGAGPDGGVDLVLRKGQEKFLVQCKQWKAFKVGVAIVRQLYGVMAAKGAAGGFVVTSGSFTAEAIEFATGRNVTLVDGAKLFGLIQQAKTARAGQGGATRAEKAEVSVTCQPVTPFAATALAAPLTITCPSCSSAMVRRVATRGDNAGSAFWGCAAYPKCRGTWPLGKEAARFDTAKLDG